MGSDAQLASGKKFSRGNFLGEKEMFGECVSGNSLEFLDFFGVVPG